MLVTNGMRRWITDPLTYDTCHFSWNKYVITPEPLSWVREGPVITANPNFIPMEECSRVQLEGDSNRYLVFGGELHLIPDQATYDRLFNNGDGVVKYYRLYLPMGMPLTDAQLIRPIGHPSVYLHTNKVKYHIADPHTMQECNFSSAKIIDKPEAEVFAIRNAYPIKN